MNKVHEITSPDGKYCARISELPTNLWCVDVIRLASDSDTVMHSIAADPTRAWKLASSALTHWSGMDIDLAPQPLTIQWIREYSGDPNARIVELSSMTVESEFGPIVPSCALDFSGLFLVRDSENELDWWMGSESEPGKVICWGNYGCSLSSAIDAL